MLDKKLFLKCFNTLLLFGSVEPDKQRTEMYYKLMANDFDDKEFSSICGDICKSEHLFGKYPDPKVFYDRKKTAQENILIEEGSFYLDDTMPQYRAVISDLDQDTRDRVCDNVWKWLIRNRRGEMVSEQFIIERLKQFRPIQTEAFELPESIGKKLIGVIKKI